MDTLSPQQKEHFDRALEASRRSNHDYVINLLKPLVLATPGHMESRRLLRRHELLKFKALPALQRNLTAVKVQPALMKGRSALKKSPQDALAAAEDALEQDPGNKQANELLADAARAAGIMDLVVMAYETIREANPKDLDNLKTLGRAYMETGNTLKAQQAFEAARVLAPHDGDALKGLKDASAMGASKEGSWEQGDYRASLRNEEEAKKLEQASRVVKSAEAVDAQLADLYPKYEADPNNLQVVKQIAELLERKGAGAEALPYYEWAHHLSPADTELEKRIHKLRAASLESQVQAKEAEVENASDPATRAALEEELQHLRQSLAQFMISTLKERVDRHPTDKSLRFDYGEALFNAGMVNEALPELQQAVNQPHVRSKALHMLGLCYWSKNMLPLAIKQFQTAESELTVMDAFKKRLKYDLGCVLEAAQQPAEALKQFTDIYEVDYHYKDVARRVESAHT